MHSFNPGTKVVAQLPNKTIWRIAKVAEPEPNQKQDPAVVYVIFPGKSKKVQRNLRQVKLHVPEKSQALHAPVLDLTSYTTPEQNKSKSLPSYSNPWDPNSPQPAPPIPFNSHDLQSVLPSSPPARTNPPPPVQNLPSSSRDRLVSNSYPYHHVNQTHAQVVRDTPLPTYSDHESPSWLGLRRPPSVETPLYTHAPVHDQNFVSESFTTNPHTSHFTPLHQNSTTPHIRSHPLPKAPPSQIPASYGPSNLRQPPIGPGWSNTNSAHLNSSPYPAGPLPYSSSSQAPQRNGLTPFADDRHPYRSVNRNLRIPRTGPSRNDFRKEPRHPQSGFDDDVRIPRNIRHSGRSSGMDEKFSDNPKSSYSTSKRRKLDFGHDMMPPPSEKEAATFKLSRRLAKREFNRHCNRWDDGQNDDNLPLLPYQRRLIGEDNGVIVAPSFSLLESRHEELLKASSDDETNILEEVFTGLSLSSAESFLESGVEHPNLARRFPPLAVQSGTRKKNRPKKLRALSQGERQLDLGDCSPAMVTAKKVESLNDQRDSEFPIPKVFGCSCPENDKEILQHQDTIQCCRCSLWLHSECAGFESGDLGRTRDDLQLENTNFICIQCLDDHVSLPPAERSLQQFSREGAIWFSSIPRLTKRMRGLGITATDPQLHYAPASERGHCKHHWLREPLAEDEKSARLRNLERLREGVANASVGTREREVVDPIFLKGLNAGGI